jgi:hypothetical protein
MKTLLLACCAALALGSGCATYDSGGTADDTVVVTGAGTGDTVVISTDREQNAYQPYPYNYHYNTDPGYGYYRSPVPTVWKQGSPNGQDWVDARPEFRFWGR